MKSLVFFLVVLTAACSGNPAGPSPTSAPSAPPVQVAPPPPPPPPPPLFTVSGSGNSVFNVPSSVTRMEIRGVWSGTGTSNFIVRRVGGTSIVNAILREMPNRTYVGVHAVAGIGVVEIISSENISSWVFTEIR